MHHEYDQPLALPLTVCGKAMDQNPQFNQPVALNDETDSWPMQTPHTGWPMQTPHAGWPMQTPHAGWLMQTSHAGWPMGTPYAGWPMQTPHVGWPIEAPHYDGPATGYVDFLRLHRRQLTYAARPRWPMPQQTSRAPYVVLLHA